MFVIQTVCRGNVCRSPLAEHLLARSLGAAGLDAGRDFHVFSSGTAAYGGGARVSNGTWKELHVRGIDAAGHRSRQTTAADLHASDLIITMEAAHSRDTIELEPSCRSRVFTLKELVAIAESDPAGPWRGAGISAVAMLDRARPAVSEGDPRWDITDPLGGSPPIFAECAGSIDDLVGRAVGVLWERAEQSNAGTTRSNER